MACGDRDVLLAALSALTGASVKSHTELKTSHNLCQSMRSWNDELTIDNYLSNVFSMGPCYGGVLLASSLPEERELFVNMETFCDQKFDYDFTSGSDSTTPSRGGESYTRPWGWYRFALRVLNKYKDGNAWLGSPGWRNQSSPGEWPVSFHGTSIEGAKGIPVSHYKPGPGAVYGRGIYSTPDINEANAYTKQFTFKGITYKVIMQNRINPRRREKTSRDGYWLIPIPDGTTPEAEKELVESSIRPYGILIKKM